MKNISKSDKDTGLIFEAYADSKKELLNEFTPTQGAVGGALAGGALGHLTGPRKAAVVPGADVAAGFQPAQVMDPAINDKITNVMSGLQAQDGGQRSLAFAELAANKDEILGALRSDPTNTDAAALAANLETALQAYTPQGAWYDKEFDPNRVGVGAGIGGVGGYMAGDEEEGVQTASTEIKEEPLNEITAITPKEAKKKTAADVAADKKLAVKANRHAQETQGTTNAAAKKEVTGESTHWLKKARLFRESKKKLVKENIAGKLALGGLGAWGGSKVGQHIKPLAAADWFKQKGAELGPVFQRGGHPELTFDPTNPTEWTPARLDQFFNKGGWVNRLQGANPSLNVFDNPNVSNYGTTGAIAGGVGGAIAGHMIDKKSDERDKKHPRRSGYVRTRWS